MSNGLANVFSGGVSLERVNPLGLGLMALAVALLIAARPISKRWPESRRQGAETCVRLAALLVCCAGALIAIM